MLSDALMVLFHRAPVLLGVVIAPPRATASERLLDHLDSSLPSNAKGLCQQVYVRWDPLLCTGDNTKGYVPLPHPQCGCHPEGTF